MQVVALAREDVMGLFVDLDVQVARRPSPGPTSPWAARRTRMPSPTPAGILTVISRRARTRPSPMH
ncbi:chaperone DnaJ 2 domain protein [Mycobacterium kansasii 732]|nr:chaperone DnaJ 2 domain protein [Mycobacterium kansasii 732]